MHTGMQHKVLMEKLPLKWTMKNCFAQILYKNNLIYKWHLNVILRSDIKICYPLWVVLEMVYGENCSISHLKNSDIFFFHGVDFYIPGMLKQVFTHIGTKCLIYKVYNEP